MTALIITLFLIQLIMIFIIVILNSKISKFKDLELRQNQLIEEMDNTISVYLLEMKEENDRLIDELKKSNVSVPKTSRYEALPIEKLADSVNENSQPMSFSEPVNVEESQEVETPHVYVPVKHAASAYTKQKAHVAMDQEMEEVQAELLSIKENPQPVKKEQTYEQQVVALYKEGNSIEEIAKLMQRGKTEIELLIKFHA
ncbi:hypothetical protein DCE79_04520 [Lysinibacillus sp. 2017]|nr:hypothetical protein DCE79_04520 [Lysinibacillus sp. 2017]TGN37458.1 hypothetical protein E4L99_02475 [Lysinibacillus sp. S2017]